jgi:hypothetical protein
MSYQFSIGLNFASAKKITLWATITLFLKKILSSFILEINQKLQTSARSLIRNLDLFPTFIELRSWNIS